jgi:hypothetical protein
LYFFAIFRPSQSCRVPQYLCYLSRIFNRRKDRGRRALFPVDDGDDENNEVAQIFIQTKEQRELFKKFGDLVEIDGTYRVTKIGMPLYTILVEDNFGIGQPICYMFLREETTMSIKTSLHLFAEVLV